MTDEIAAPAAQNAPAEPAAASVPASVVPASPEIPSPDAPSEPQSSPAPAPSAADAPKPADSLLKPAEPEAKPAPEAEATESQTPAPEEAAVPTYEPFTLPEGVTLDTERLADFNKTLGDFEIASKASHAEVQKLGQALVDRHISEIQSAQQRQVEKMTQDWHAQRAEDVRKFKDDPQYGGNRLETSLREANDFIRDHGGDAADVEQFYKDLEATGMASKPSMARFILNIRHGATFKNPQPLAAPPIAKPIPLSRTEKMYGKAKN